MVGPGQGEEEWGTCGEKEMMIVPSSTFAADETPSPHGHPSLPPFPRFQQHSVVVVPRSRGKVTVVVTIGCVGTLHGISGAVEMVPVLC